MTCILCANAGREPGKIYKRSTICQDCRAMLRASGRAWCPNARHVVPAAEMQRSACRACDNARRAERRARNAEQERATRLAYYQRNRERIIAEVMAWKARNPDRHRRHVANYMRRWRAANPDRHLANNARYRAKNRERIRLMNRQSRVRAKLRILRGAR